MAGSNISAAEMQMEDYNYSKAADAEIKIENLCIEFPDKKGGEPVIALQNVNLEIKQGEFISLLGPSGCGKITLLRNIADLQQPSSGSISVRGMTPREVRLQKKYGIVFQNALAIKPERLLMDGPVPLSRSRKSTLTNKYFESRIKIYFVKRINLRGII